MVVERYLPRRTAIEQIANIYNQWEEKDSIHLALESAFDVEAVTKHFFTEYKRVFRRRFGEDRGIWSEPGREGGQEALCSNPVQPADVRLLSLAQGMANLQRRKRLSECSLEGLLLHMKTKPISSQTGSTFFSFPVSITRSPKI